MIPRQASDPGGIGIPLGPLTQNTHMDVGLSHSQPDHGPVLTVYSKDVDQVVTVVKSWTSKTLTQPSPVGHLPEVTTLTSDDDVIVRTVVPSGPRT